MTKLEEQYAVLREKYHFDAPLHAENLTKILRETVKSFVNEHRETAVYCYGIHTKMMMADFMFEMKPVHYIIDNYCTEQPESGFEVIPETAIEEKGIDAVIISSYKYKDALKESLRIHHPRTVVLDIYKVLDQQGIHLRGEYYRYGHPYHHYHRIHELRTSLENMETQESWRSLVQEFLDIKDFRLAGEAARHLAKFTKNKEDQAMAEEIEMLLMAERDAVRQLPKNHVVMICMDGMRRRDVCPEKMPQLSSVVAKKGRMFADAYAYSSSTYESLIPAYSQNTDQRTRYFEKSSVDAAECPFFQEAAREHRSVHFYTDMAEYIESEEIQYQSSFETVTQKIWSFVKDASQEKKGLYYLHILYESHYTFSNPYTRGTFLSEGTAMLFDYLEKLGGELRTDYVRQHDDALRYLDDTVAPFLQELPCRCVLFADHGNLVLSPGTELAAVNRNELTCHEDWMQIPFVICAPEYGAGTDGRLLSLLEINDVVCSLLQGRHFDLPMPDYVKIGRSELYNPDFRFLYQQMGEAQRLLAFEGFVFVSGEKIVVYSDGAVELYDRKDDSEIDDPARIKELLSRVQEEITVCPLEAIRVD